MGERTTDAIASLVFIVLIIGLEYIHLDITFAKPYIWMFAILFHAYIYGKHAFPKRNWIITTPMGLVLLLAAQSVFQTLWFYSGHLLGHASDAWTLVLALASAHITMIRINTNDEILAPATEENASGWPKERIIFASILFVAALGAAAYVMVGAWQSQTLNSIRTPWPLLPSGTLAAIAIIWMTAVLSAVKVRAAAVTAAHAGLAFVSTLSIAPLVYKLGYGFDGFLHIAGEKVLAASGTLNPKPFYYIGQYVFVTWLSRVSQISITDISKWLVPVAAAFLIPICLAFAYHRFNPKAGASLILALLPLSLFVGSTPQGFSLVLGITALICAIGTTRKDIGIRAPIWLGLWSVAVHPLSGLPLLGISLAIILAGQSQKWMQYLSWPTAVLSGISVPAAFYIASNYTQGLNIEWSLQQILHISNWINPLMNLFPWLSNKYVLWPAWASLLGLFVPLLSLLLSILSLYYFKKERKLIGIIILSAFILIFSAGFLENVSDFAFLIQYEKGDYALRLMQIAVFILLIGGASAMAKILEKIRTAQPIIVLLAIILFGAVGAANAHNALPRHDAAQASRGWSTGQADIDTVYWIDRTAAGRDYTVLSNQSVSAAAIKEFGFKRYADDVFYYPIPTGGPLYAVYLRMTYEDPSLDTAKEAAKLGKSDLVFVVINDYWWKATELNEQISQIADQEWSIKDGKIMIYVFDFSKK